MHSLGRLVVLEDALLGGQESLEVEVGAEGSQVLPIVVLGVDLEDANEQLRHVLQTQIQVHGLGGAELALVGGEELDLDSAGELLEERVLVLLHLHLLARHELSLLLDALQLVLVEEGQERRERLLLLNQEVLQVPLHNSRVFFPGRRRVGVVAPLGLDARQTLALLLLARLIRVLLRLDVECIQLAQGLLQVRQEELLLQLAQCQSVPQQLVNHVHPQRLELLLWEPLQEGQHVLEPLSLLLEGELLSLHPLQHS